MKYFSELIDQAKTKGPYRIAVAAAEDKEVLAALKMAQDMGFVYPVLVGDEESIRAFATEVGLREYELVGAATPEEAVKTAVQLVRSGEAKVLMKGLVNTSVYMRGILDREQGLRTGRLLSMLAVYELPQYHKLIFGTDSGINVAPTFAQKRDILKNALLALSNMGITEPKVAALAANEMVDEKISATVDAAGLVQAVNSGELPSCIIEGPIAFDVAFDKEAAKHKGIESRVSGDVDLLVFPTIEAGNILGKSWIHLNKAKWGGMVLGASAPVILGSRADTAEIKIHSIALGCLAAE